MTFKCGTFTKDMNTTTTDTIAHGLGTTPKGFELTVMYVDGNFVNYVLCIGSYDGTTNDCVFFGPFGVANAQSAGNGGGSIICQFWKNASGPNNNQAVATWDGTNVYLTWSKTGSLVGMTANFLWKAFV
jgi:hypothetical protein